jgi:invasion protein IalB
MRLVNKRCVSKVRIGGIAVLCLIGLGVGAMAQTLQPKAPVPGHAGATAPAQAAAGETAAPNPTWMVNCTNVTGGFDCRASQTLISKDSRQRILTLVVRTTPGAKKPVIMIQGPLGIYLPAGITLQIGEEAPKVLPLQSCDQAGCLTEYAVSDAEIEAMRGGVDLKVTMQDLRGAPITLQVAGVGFAAAFAKMK